MAGDGSNQNQDNYDQLEVNIICSISLLRECEEVGGCDGSVVLTDSVSGDELKCDHTQEAREVIISRASVRCACFTSGGARITRTRTARKQMIDQPAQVEGRRESVTVEVAP